MWPYSRRAVLEGRAFWVLKHLSKNRYENKCVQLEFDARNFLDQFMSHLEHEERKRFMQVCYEKILLYPQVILSDKIPARVRINSVSILIKFFEDAEEYEKCAELKKIIEEIQQ